MRGRKRSVCTGIRRKTIARRIVVEGTLTPENDFLDFLHNRRIRKRFPAEIGGKSLVTAFSLEVLAATFQTDPASFPRFPFTAQDPLIVPRLNPVDSPPER